MLHPCRHYLFYDAGFGLGAFLCLPPGFRLTSPKPCRLNFRFRVECLVGNGRGGEWLRLVGSAILLSLGPCHWTYICRDVVPLLWRLFEAEHHAPK